MVAQRWGLHLFKEFEHGLKTTPRVMGLAFDFIDLIGIFGGLM
jgi:hypothetical protein